MYRIPKELDLSSAIGQFTTQFCIGAHDLQFDLGKVHFSVQSKVILLHGQDQVGEWQFGSWPSSSFREVFNAEVKSVSIPNDIEIAIHFANGISMHIYDDSDQYESFQIRIKGLDHVWVI